MKKEEHLDYLRMKSSGSLQLQGIGVRKKPTASGKTNQKEKLKL